MEKKELLVYPTGQLVFAGKNVGQITPCRGKYKLVMNYRLASMQALTLEEQTAIDLAEHFISLNNTTTDGEL